LPQPAPRVSGAQDVPIYEFDYDLTQREGITLVGDPDYVLSAIKVADA
jgi:hypothetical protein